MIMYKCFPSITPYTTRPTNTNSNYGLNDSNTVAEGGENFLAFCSTCGVTDIGLEKFVLYLLERK